MSAMGQPANGRTNEGAASAIDIVSRIQRVENDLSPAEQSAVTGAMLRGSQDQIDHSTPHPNIFLVSRLDKLTV